MSDSQFILVFLMGWLSHKFWAWAVIAMREAFEEEKERAYDWEEDDELGW